MEPIDLFDVLLGAHSTLLERFLAVATQLQDRSEEAERLFNLLPKEIQGVPTFFERLTSRWRYDFGTPIELSSNQVLVGTNTWPEVEHLYRCLTEVGSRVSPDKLSQYITRLSSRSKHQDVLFEARPLFSLARSVAVEFEVVGHGRGNRTIDWRLLAHDEVEMLLEVKFRLGDVARHINTVAPSLNAGLPEVPWGPGDPDPLFRDTYEKFLPADPHKRLQGTWIHHSIKVRRSALESYFQSIPDDLLHFAVLSGWDSGAYLLTRPAVDRGRLTAFFGITEVDNAVAD
jgi:hypothetical protein